MPTVGGIARSLGYASEYAFNRARGITPGRGRTRRREAGAGPRLFWAS
jgi:hypothetical protein